jgi:hypothetical protein
MSIKDNNNCDDTVLSSSSGNQTSSPQQGRTGQHQESDHTGAASPRSVIHDDAGMSTMTLVQAARMFPRLVLRNSRLPTPSTTTLGIIEDVLHLLDDAEVDDDFFNNIPSLVPPPTRRTTRTFSFDPSPSSRNNKRQRSNHQHHQQDRD